MQQSGCYNVRSSKEMYSLLIENSYKIFLSMDIDVRHAALSFRSAYNDDLW